MSFAKTTGEVNTLAELYSALQSFLVARGYTALQTGTSRAGNSYTIYHSTGESTQEDIYLGVTTYRASLLRTGIQFEAYTGFTCGVDFDQQLGVAIFCPALCCCGLSCLPTLALWDLPMKYWFFGDKDVITGVVRLSNLYFAFYVGLTRRYALRCQDPYPMIVDAPSMCHAGVAPAGESVQRSFGRAGSAARCFHVMASAGCWIPYRTCINNSTETGICNQLTWPEDALCCLFLPGDGITGYKPPRHILVPIIVSNVGGDRGEMKWVYKTTGRAMSAEQVVLVDGNEYICFPDGDAPGNQDYWIAFRNY